MDGVFQALMLLVWTNLTEATLSSNTLQEKEELGAIQDIHVGARTKLRESSYMQNHSTIRSIDIYYI